MRSIAVALTWEFWRRSRRWIFFEIAVMACATAAMYGRIPSISARTHAKVHYMTLFYKFIYFAYFVLSFQFHRKSKRLGFPAHLYVKPNAGTAPISFQSGQIHRVKFRRACNKHLRTAVHQWADRSRFQCTWAQIYYEQKRREGKSRACATRCLGQRWLKILWKMWQTGEPYNEQIHTRNQIKPGSCPMDKAYSSRPVTRTAFIVCSIPWP
jgi:hypothetical protein